MKKVKNYITAEMAKKKISKYAFWSIRDQAGIVICDSNREDNKKSFDELIDESFENQVDKEISIKYGTTDNSARHNPPTFIKITEDVEWIDPEPDAEVSINGVPHKLDKNGNVNINLKSDNPTIEQIPTDYLREEFDVKLAGLRQESENKEQQIRMEMQNQNELQTIRFREMMVEEKEASILEREQQLEEREEIMKHREDEMAETLTGYMSVGTKALGGLITKWISGNKSEGLGGTKNEEQQKQPPREETKFDFTIREEDEEGDLVEQTESIPNEDELNNVEVQQEENDNTSEEKSEEENTSYQETESKNNGENRHDDSDQQDEEFINN